MRIAKLLAIGFALTLSIGLSGFAGSETDAGLRRISCANLMVFAPANGVSDADVCRAHGGVASAGAQDASSALVILVRNRPAGGDTGLASFNKGS
jgi:hypothetical protein